MTKLIPGTPAPDFELPTDSGAPFKLSDHKGKSVLLYFYPQADTPACTNQNLDFTRLAEDFERANTILVGISPDSVEKLAKFRAKYDLSPILIADPDRVAIEAYGAWGEKKNYGKTYTGLIRTTVLVDAEGNIAQVWPNIRAKGHADRIITAVG
ncbi:peroxiredoxin [Pelagibacterium lentulum]|uniref:thioredoxin-dependent peroxiredoxin n=1 Tax=Pelagibacterium lentulum TaxID=2029865 RepID=A0A916RJR8_9HYPH|nr:peroxiredoxin [Pelagibacterium lentulum]GGA59999.1 hypothetical protein GCM10011499_32780 [Pelagibacterium lentulum]